MSQLCIILPVYNGEKTIKETVESLLCQTYYDFTLYICIDGTHDNSKLIIESFVDKRIKLFENEYNIGLARTLNKLMMLLPSDTKYVAMAEQDDYYYPYRLAEEYDFLEKNNQYGMVSGIAEFYTDESKTTLFPGILAKGGDYPQNRDEFLLFMYREQSKVVNTAIMFRYDVYVQNGMSFVPHFQPSGDWAFFLYFLKYSNIYGLNKILVRMNRLQDRTSITMNSKQKYKAARELLRYFRYEYNISKIDYKYALTTQRLIEIGEFKFFIRLLLLLWYLLKTPTDKRISNKIDLELKKAVRRLR